MKLPNWVETIDQTILEYLSTLKKNDSRGRYLPCRTGVTIFGREAELGFSCFALRIFYILNYWNHLSRTTRQAWIDNINSFQFSSNLDSSDDIEANAYIDPVLIDYLRKHPYPTFRAYVKHVVMSVSRAPRSKLKPYERAIIAETKQVIATLSEIGEDIPKPYMWFPNHTEALDSYMARFDWRYPWDAGGQTAALAVFLAKTPSLQATSISITELQNSARSFYLGIADPKTGGYFKESCPHYSHLVNGAMKVLTALDWLDEPIHYPTQLIDTALSQKPNPEGCHLVDTVYVLYRCSLESDYRSPQIRQYLANILEMIKAHYNVDGGFSYYIGQAQTRYYGLPISRGNNESDIHGTILLLWALSMIRRLLDPEDVKWNLPRP